MDSYDKELMDRVIRIESRMVQLGDHVGANLRTKQHIEFVDDERGVMGIQIDALDVSLSRILTELRQKHPDIKHEGVRVFHHGKHVMTVMP